MSKSYSDTKPKRTKSLATEALRLVVRYKIYYEPHQLICAIKITSSIPDKYKHSLTPISAVDEIVFKRKNFFLKSWFSGYPRPYQISCGKRQLQVLANLKPTQPSYCLTRPVHHPISWTIRFRYLTIVLTDLGLSDRLVRKNHTLPEKGAVGVEKNVRAAGETVFMAYA